MTPVIWIVGELARAPGLTGALTAAGFDLSRASGVLDGLAEATYDGRGLVLLDAADDRGRAALADPGLCAVPVLALAAADERLPPGVLRLVVGHPLDELVHHVGAVLAEPRNLRRQPRVPVDLPVRIDGHAATARDVSLYGMWLSPGPALAPGTPVELAVQLGDGANVALTGRVLARRGEGMAVRCRPCSDQDLLLWLHLILGGLERSPLHADADPFDFPFDEA
jgi:hypothetical protein